MTTSRKRYAPQFANRPSTEGPRTPPLAGALMVPLACVLPDPDQPRQNWTHGDGAQRLDELVASIEEFGVLQPLLVRRDESYTDATPRFRIIAGGRRCAAAARAGLATIPVIVSKEPAERVLVLQLIENLQRQDLAPMDEARAYEALMDLEKLSPPAMAERLHISAQKVRERLRLLADQVLADAVERRQISATAARDIARLPDEQVAQFRKRVADGEVLQSNDVALARAQLAAQGIVNPRRKGPPTLLSPLKKQASLVSTPMTLPPPATQPARELIGVEMSGGGAVAQEPNSTGGPDDAYTVGAALADTGVVVQAGTQPAPVPSPHPIANCAAELVAWLTETLIASLQKAPDKLVTLEETLTYSDAPSWSLSVLAQTAQGARDRLSKHT